MDIHPPAACARPRGDAPHRPRRRRPAGRRPVDPGRARPPARRGRDARSRARRRPARRAPAVRGDPRPPARRRDPGDRPRRPPVVLRLHLVLRHLAGRARRLPRQRAQHGRLDLDAEPGPDHDRARPGALAVRRPRPARDGRRDLRQRRLGRQPDGPRVRARAPGRRHVRPLVLYASDESHSSVFRAARALGSGRGRCAVATDDAARLARSAGRARSRATAPPASAARGRGQRRHHLHRGDRPAAGGRRGLPRHGVWLHVDAAYGGGAAITERGRARWPGSSWPTRSPSTRTSGSTSRSSSAACWCARRPCSSGPSRSTPTTCRTPSADGSTSATAACSSPASFRALKLWLVAAGVRRRRLPHRGGALARARSARRPAGRGAPRARAARAAVARDRLLPPGRPGRLRGGARGGQRRPGRGARAAARRWPPRPGCAAPTRCGCASSTTPASAPTWSGSSRSWAPANASSGSRRPRPRPRSRSPRRPPPTAAGRAPSGRRSAATAGSRLSRTP